MNSARVFKVDPYDLYSSFFESIVGFEMGRRTLRHTFNASFGYLPNAPEVLAGFQVIASETLALVISATVLTEVGCWQSSPALAHNAGIASAQKRLPGRDGKVQRGTCPSRTI